MKENPPIDLDAELSEEELYELDDFWADQEELEAAMDVATLEGFLTAITIGPRTMMPSEWLRWIWDMDEGEAQPEFENAGQADRILGLIMRFYNSLIRRFMIDPSGFEPIYFLGYQWGAAEWCEGFLKGMTLDSERWGPLLVEQPQWFTPFIRLGTDSGIELIKQDDDAEHWMNEVAPSLVNLQAFWQEQRSTAPTGIREETFAWARGPGQPIVRSEPKISRNGPCPCGSGKKYKKCCGSGTPTLH